MPMNDFRDYDEYWTLRGFHEPSKKRAHIISKFIESDSTILDVGCGDGTVIDFISKNNSPMKVTGVDISKKAVEFVKKKGYDAREIYILSEEFANFIKDIRFNYIIITEVLEHIQEPEKILQILKGSYNESIFISIPNSGFFLHRLRLLSVHFPVVTINVHIKEHIRFWTHKDFLYWCEYLGFKVVNYSFSQTSELISIDLGKIMPSLFAKQIIYEIQNHKKS